MMKNIIIAFSLILNSFFMYSQNTIKGVLNFENSINRVVLYNVNAFEKKYVKHAYIKDNKFELKLKKGLEKGIYKLELDLKNDIKLDILFTGNDIDITWGSKEIKFSDKAADMFHRYTNINSQLQAKLDEIQINYFKYPSEELSQQYREGLDVLNKLYDKVYNNQEDSYYKKVIKLSKGYNSSEVTMNPNSYLDSIKKHHFDRVDFSDNEVLHSYITTELIIDYIFYLNYSEDKKSSDMIHMENIKHITSLIPNEKYNAEMYLFLLNQFLNEKNTEMSSYIKDRYTRMPIDFQDLDYLKHLEKQQSLSVDAIAPNFDWTDKDVKKNLHEIINKEKTVLIFWSSECSHCLREIPILRDSLKNDKVQVIAIGIERKSKKWKDEIAKYTDWTHVLALKKWDNHIARLYDVIGTPSYYILDKNAKILAKPEDVNDVLSWIKEN